MFPVYNSTITNHLSVFETTNRFHTEVNLEDKRLMALSVSAFNQQTLLTHYVMRLTL